MKEESKARWGVVACIVCFFAVLAGLAVADGPTKEPAKPALSIDEQMAKDFDYKSPAAMKQAMAWEIYMMYSDNLAPSSCFSRAEYFLEEARRHRDPEYLKKHPPKAFVPRSEGTGEGA